MKRYWSIALFLLPNLVAGQADQVDSILALPEDTNKIFSLSDLCFAYRGIDGDSAMMFGERALALAEELGHPKGVAQVYNDISIVLMDKNEYDQALMLLSKALTIRDALKDTMGMAAIYNKLANIYQEQFKLEEALKYNFKALPIYEKNGPPVYHAYILNNIGILQFNLREFDKAIETQEEAKEIRIEIGDDFGLAYSYSNLANCYLSLHDTAQAVANYETAIAYFRKVGKKEELAIQLHNLAGVYIPQGDLPKALEMYTEAYNLRLEIDDRKAISSTLIGLGDTYTAMGRYEDARAALQRSLELSREIDTRSEILFAYLKLARLYGIMNSGDSAILYYEHYNAIKDTIFSEDLGRQVAEAETKYETAKKEQENLELEVKVSRQNIWNIALVSGVLLLILGGGFFFYRDKQKEQQRIKSAIISQKEQGLKAVLHAQEDERRRIARELHDSVGQTLSGVKMAWQRSLADLKGVIGDQQEEKMERTTKLLDEASTEVRMISHQMMPRALQETGLVPALQDLLDSSLGQSPIQYSLEHHNADGRFPEEVEIGIFRVCQELLTNIIKHSEATEVSVQLIRTGKNLMLMVEDNGKGFGSSETKEGIGLLNIRSRMESVHGDVNFEPSPGSGTVATIRVPVA